ncbi:MAG TPA: hypothetical protein VE088_05970 [Gaiellaceae bacterium]|jgi:hypothetical protein|nr:hypothetical protein [Gaiellaceae bacterium]
MRQDSDWAMPGESETVTICGTEDGGLAPVDWTALGTSYGPPKRVRFDLVRLLVWGLTGLIAVVVIGTAWAGWGRSTSPAPVAQQDYPLEIVFGDRGTNAASPYSANGSESVCTDKVYDSGSGGWRCTTWSADSGGFPISAAVPYDGPCDEMRVDQSSGKWTCVSGGVQQQPTLAQS